MCAMTPTIISCALSAVTLLAYNVHTFQPCLTPDGEPGDCIPLKHCDSLYSFFDNVQISSEVSDHLKKSHCGDDGGHPKVCCPAKDQPLERVFIANSDLLPDPDTCGLQTSGKIVGGEIADLDEFPWMALLQYNTKEGKVFECGGALINKRYVLTAAHCLNDALVSVRLGEYNIDTNPDCVVTAFGKDCAPPPIDFDIEEKIMHNSYSNSSLYNDIGLIRLSRDVEYSDFIRPICLPITADEAFKNYVGQTLCVAGWGLMEHEVKSNYKRKVNIPVQDLPDCIKCYKRKAHINLPLNDGHICAGGIRGKDSCKGDSGGPLMHYKIDKNKEAHFYAVGVVSFGLRPCGIYKLPGVYTRISKYISWIVNSLRP